MIGIAFIRRFSNGEYNDYKCVLILTLAEMNSTSMQDFSTLSVIGKGTYAKVVLVRHLKDNQLYALKILKKKYIVEKNQEKHIMTEKEILAQIEHPFLVKMKLSFQDERKLYFLLEYCPGGELFSLLAAKDKLTEDQYYSPYRRAKFYAAQIILALEALHKHKVIYREYPSTHLVLNQKTSSSIESVTSNSLTLDYPKYSNRKKQQLPFAELPSTWPPKSSKNLAMAQMSIGGAWGASSMKWSLDFPPSDLKTGWNSLSRLFTKTQTFPKYHSC